MKKIRILQFTIAQTKGGRTQYVLNIWNKINKNRFQFDFITFSKTRLDFEDELNSTGAHVYYISVYPQDDKEQFISEFNSILSRGYDVIEIHTSFWVSTIVEELSRKADIPKIIIHAHSTGINAVLDEKNRLNSIEIHNKVRGQLSEKVATHFWACSKEAARWLFSDRIPVEKIEILYNTIDTGRFKFNPNERDKIRESLGLKDRFVLGFTGRLELVKNVEFAISVFKKLSEDHLKLSFIIVGDGSLKEELKSKCAEERIEKNVIFTGLVDNVTKYLNAMDIYLLPSHFEGMPLSLLEAQCNGLPCIASTVIPDEAVAIDIVHRLPLDELEWIECCKKYIKGYDRRDRSEELIQKGYDIGEFVKKLENKYLE